MKRALLIVFTFLIAYPLSASHIAGGVIEVRCVGGNTFEITLIKYRDIAGITYNPNENVTIDPMGPGSNTVVSLPRVSQTSIQPPVTNPCLIPSANTGQEEHVFRGQVTISNGSDYYIYHEDNSRPAGLLNIVNSANVGSTVYAEFPDPGVYGCNNSPVFDVGPPVSVCVNEPLNYDLQLVDRKMQAVVHTWGIARHPAQLYESGTCLLLFIILLAIWYKWKNKTPEGLLLGLFLIWIFGLRWFHETFKENQVAFENEMTYNMGQILSIPLVLIGVFILIRVLVISKKAES